VNGSAVSVAARAAAANQESVCRVTVGSPSVGMRGHVHAAGWGKQRNARAMAHQISANP
jgi:hypothetical protein